MRPSNPSRNSSVCSSEIGHLYGYHIMIIYCSDEGKTRRVPYVGTPSRSDARSGVVSIADAETAAVLPAPEGRFQLGINPLPWVVPHKVVSRRRPSLPCRARPAQGCAVPPILSAEGARGARESCRMTADKIGTPAPRFAAPSASLIRPGPA